jgi:hypothetical protein
MDIMRTTKELGDLIPIIEGLKALGWGRQDDFLWAGQGFMIGYEEWTRNDSDDGLVIMKRVSINPDGEAEEPSTLEVLHVGLSELEVERLGL